MSKPKKLKQSTYGSKTADYLDVAYKDYLAPRVLFNANLLLQGAVLASTAIEKYLKAILAFRGNEGFISAAPQFVDEIRKAVPDHFYEVEYFAPAAPSDGKFMRPGFVPVPNSVNQYQMAFKPIPPGSEV